MSLGMPSTEAELQRFVQNEMEQPGPLTVGPVSGERVEAETLDLTDRIGEIELAQPNTWLRLATIASRKIAFGVKTITGTGVSQASASVDHGLGVTPLIVLATAKRTAGSAALGALLATVEGFTDTSFTLGIRDVSTGNFGDDHDVYWLAIG